MAAGILSVALEQKTEIIAARAEKEGHEFNSRQATMVAVRLFVDELAKTELDRTHFSVVQLNDSDEKAYWFSKSPAERLEALELMRQMIYGYDPARTRLQRILTVASLGED
jgi:hypothetical protein